MARVGGHQQDYELNHAVNNAQSHDVSTAAMHMDGGITLDLNLNILGGGKSSTSDSNKKWL